MNSKIQYSRTPSYYLPVGVPPPNSLAMALLNKHQELALRALQALPPNRAYFLLASKIMGT